MAIILNLFSIVFQDAHVQRWLSCKPPLTYSIFQIKMFMLYKDQNVMQVQSVCYTMLSTTLLSNRI